MIGISCIALITSSTSPQSYRSSHLLLRRTSSSFFESASNCGGNSPVVNARKYLLSSSAARLLARHHLSHSSGVRLVRIKHRVPPKTSNPLLAGMFQVRACLNHTAAESGGRAWPKRSTV